LFTSAITAILIVVAVTRLLSQSASLSPADGPPPAPAGGATGHEHGRDERENSDRRNRDASCAWRPSPEVDDLAVAKNSARSRRTRPREYAGLNPCARVRSTSFFSATARGPPAGPRARLRFRCRGPGRGCRRRGSGREGRRARPASFRSHALGVATGEASLVRKPCRSGPRRVRPATKPTVAPGEQAARLHRGVR